MGSAMCACIVRSAGVLSIYMMLRRCWAPAQIKSLRPKEMSNKRLARPAKTVHRIYGGHLSHRVVKDRIVRAFLIEEQKIIKKVAFPLLQPPYMARPPCCLDAAKLASSKPCCIR